MSKTVKRKVSVELQEKPSSKNRLSVFDRLGTKKSKSISESKSLIDDFKQTLSAAVSISTKPILSKPETAELEDADPDSLEKKRLELQKELKMESRRAAALRKRKRAQSESSSSSYSSSDSSSSSSSSSSEDERHKSRKMKAKRRDSSSSSDEYAKKLAKKKRACQSKKEKLHKLSRKHEIMATTHKSHRRSTSPPLVKKHRGESSSVMLSPSGKVVKNLKISTTVDKHHRLREKEIEAMQREKERDRERDRERLRMRDERTIRSRSPKRRTPPPKRTEFPKSQRYSDEQERRVEKERPVVREKERGQPLERSQERPRERERSSKDLDKNARLDKNSRLLPRPAERAMALAAAQERRSAERDVHVPSYSARSYPPSHEPSFEHRKHPKEHERSYESHSRRTEQSGEFHSSSSYRREWHDEAPAKERDWHEESGSKEIYERSTERHAPPTRKEWPESSGKWESRKGAAWQQESESSQWSSRYKEESWQEANSSSVSHHSRSMVEKPVEHSPSSSSISKPGIGLTRRWPSWRGRGRGASGHHSEFRRGHHHTEILEERGEIYRRHINPQGTTASKPSPTPKPSEAQDKSLDEPTKASTADENPDEEIADDLSEISDEFDDILELQEDVQMKEQPPQADVEKSPAKEASSPEPPTSEMKPKSNSPAEKPIDEEIEQAAPAEPASVTKISEDADRSKDLSDDIDLDFEEISDGELEEEACLRESRIKGIGDALGVDWSSLVEESKAMLQEKLLKRETSAKQQWNPSQILLDIGVSYKMAGSGFAQEALLNAFETLKAESEQTIDEKPLQASDESLEENHVDIKIKTEIPDDIDMEPIESKVNGNHEITRGPVVEPRLHLHPLPCVQRSAQNISNKLNRLVYNASGPYSRGLCTRRDIALRRQLCNLAVNETNCKTSNGKSSSGYENIALKLFQKAVKT